MNFNEISEKAYKNEHLSKDSKILEQLVWYKIKEVYDDYKKGVFDIAESKKRKEKIFAFYIQQDKIENFYKKLNEERYARIRESEDMLKDILKSEREEINEKELTQKLIDYVTKITGIVPIKTEYDERYK